MRKGTCLTSVHYSNIRLSRNVCLTKRHNEIYKFHGEAITAEKRRHQNAMIPSSMTTIDEIWMSIYMGKEKLGVCQTTLNKYYQHRRDKYKCHRNKLETERTTNSIDDLEEVMWRKWRWRRLKQYRRRRKWCNPRTEEAEKCIYRLPPPGNGPPRQTNITEYFCERNQTRNHRRNPSGEEAIQSTQILTRDEFSCTILQWNACSLNEVKRIQLEQLAEEQKADIICVSELGRYRTINGFSMYVDCHKGTQSAIFWRKGLKMKVVQTNLNEKHKEINTQCVEINKEILLIHPYIPPSVSRNDRRFYWTDILTLTDEWAVENPFGKIIVTGDLNTRDSRLGANHDETHRYLDTVLMTFSCISDRKAVTREESMLDITLGNRNANNCVKKWKVLDKLSSDHNPTKTEVSLITSVYDNANNQSGHKITYTVVDIKKTQKQIQISLVSQKEIEELSQVNDVLKNAVVYKTIRHKPINFWTSQLRQAVKLQNKARKAIRLARERNEDTSTPYRTYKRYKNKFSKIFKKIKRRHRVAQINQACQDNSGAAVFKIIKQMEPRLNKRARSSESNTDHKESAARIADAFEMVFSQNDVQPTIDEKKEMDEQIKTVREQMRVDRLEPFTRRELRQAIVRANIRSAAGLDGVSNRLIKMTCKNEMFQNVLLSTINAQVFSKGTYPESLKTAKVIPLPKQKLGEFRPISLLSSMSKLVEYMIQIRMRELVEPKLPRQQFGCRPGHSTAQALMR